MTLEILMRSMLNTLSIKQYSEQTAAYSVLLLYLTLKISSLVKITFLIHFFAG